MRVRSPQTEIAQIKRARMIPQLGFQPGNLKPIVCEREREKFRCILSLFFILSVFADFF